MSILVSFGEFFSEFFPPSHPCVCDTLLDILSNLTNQNREVRIKFSESYKSLKKNWNHFTRNNLGS